MVPPGFHQSSTRVPAGFHQVLRGLRGRSGWIEVRFTRFCEVRFHDKVPQISTSVPRGSARAASVPQRFHKCSARLRALEGSNVSCARRVKSHRSSKLRAQKIALLIGETLSKTEINGFQHLVDLLACSDNAARNVGLVGNEITLLRDSSNKV